MPLPTVTIDEHELNRLRECEGVWQAVFHALQAGNPRTFYGPGTGRECALREIKRLQKAAVSNTVANLLKPRSAA